GGFLELSGHQGFLLVGDFSGKAKVPGFHGGRLLLDPTNININSGCGATPSSGCLTPAQLDASGFGTVSLLATTDINVNTAIGNADINSGLAGGSLTMTAGNDITVAANIGSGTGSAFNHDLTLTAGNNVNINNSIYLGNNTLTLAAGTAATPASGDVNILASNVHTLGNMIVSGRDFNVGNTNPNGASIDVGGQLSVAMSRDITVQGGSNSCDGACHIQTVVQAGSINLSGRNLLLQAGDPGWSGEAYVDVSAMGNINVNVSGQVAVRGGTANANGWGGADVHAKLHAGNDLTIHAGSVKVQGGTFNMASNSSAYYDASALLGAGNAVSITATNAIEVLGGTVNTAPFYPIYSNGINVSAAITADTGNVIVNAGSVKVQGGTVNLSNGSSSARSNIIDTSAKINAASGDVSITATGAVEVLGGDITISNNHPGDSPIAVNNFMDATAAITGQNVTIGAGGGLTVRGGTISVQSNVYTWNNSSNSFDVSARIAATSGNLGITTPSAVQVRGGDVTASNNSSAYFNNNSFSAKAALEALSGAVTITSGSLAVAGGSATLSSNYLSSNYLNLDAQVYAGVGDVTLNAAGNINVTGGTVIGANAGNNIYADATIRAANEVLATVGGTAIAINAGAITTGGDYAQADARIESAIPTTIRVSFTNLTSGGYSVNGIPGAITDGNSGFYAFGSPGILDSTLFFQYAPLPPPPLPPPEPSPGVPPSGGDPSGAVQHGIDLVQRLADAGVLITSLKQSGEEENPLEKKPTYTCQ
ncbi:MAG TPA: hypothetical protein VFQ98_06000, partial [Gallionella sp.]|nr:hypothetical protein [Gallionella sp.]